jgi:hypothetical protein
MEFTALFEKVIDDLANALFPTFVTKRAAGAKKIEERSMITCNTSEIG